jgi:hypothetical protein
LAVNQNKSSQYQRTGIEWVPPRGWFEKVSHKKGFEGGLLKAQQGDLDLCAQLKQAYSKKKTKYLCL